MTTKAITVTSRVAPVTCNKPSYTTALLFSIFDDELSILLSDSATAIAASNTSSVMFQSRAFKWYASKRRHSHGVDSINKTPLVTSDVDDIGWQLGEPVYVGFKRLVDRLKT